jgi:hypothetical protein
MRINRNTSGRFLLLAPRLRLTPQWSDSSGTELGQLVSAPTGPGSQTRTSPVLSVPVRSTTLLSSFALQRRPSFIARACGQFGPRAHLHQPMPMPQQLTHIAIFRARYARSAEKRSSIIIFSSSCASWWSVFCFLARLVFISAGSPIHNSKPNSASSRSNQRNIPSPPSPLVRRLLAASDLDRISRPPHRCGSVVVRYIASLFHQKCNLLKARMITYAYLQ